MDRKKKIEHAYIEEARRASSIFPAGTLVAHERPDFLLQSPDGRIIGIELTELCREEPRATAGRLVKIPERAREKYNQRPGSEPVDVSIAFWREEDISVNELTTSLADFVYAHKHQRGLAPRRELPKGFCAIGIFESKSRRPEGYWHSNRAFDVVPARKELIDASIAEKSYRVPAYKLAAPETWLLIVNDHFLGPGEVRTNPDDLASWEFKSDFDKVLLFLRWPGGAGEVVELTQM